MNKKYKTSELIEYIQDLEYTLEDTLKIKEIEDRLLELDNLKKPKKEVKIMKFKIFKTSDSEKVGEVEIKDINQIVELSKKSKWRNSDVGEGIIINGDTIEIYDDYREY